MCFLSIHALPSKRKTRPQFASIDGCGCGFLWWLLPLACEIPYWFHFWFRHYLDRGQGLKLHCLAQSQQWTVFPTFQSQAGSSSSYYRPFLGFLLASHLKEWVKPDNKKMTIVGFYTTSWRTRRKTSSTELRYGKNKKNIAKEIFLIEVVTLK